MNQLLYYTQLYVMRLPLVWLVLLLLHPVSQVSHGSTHFFKHNQVYEISAVNYQVTFLFLPVFLGVWYNYFCVLFVFFLVDASTSEIGLVGVQPESEDPSRVKAAVFYSITSTQKGLQVCIEHL